MANEENAAEEANTEAWLKVGKKEETTPKEKTEEVDPMKELEKARKEEMEAENKA